jgi:hypothetical protein
MGGPWTRPTGAVKKSVGGTIKSFCVYCGRLRGKSNTCEGCGAPHTKK